MSPASQTIGVGGTVVFAVSVSGGVAGEAASWTCASSDTSKATVTNDPAGCAVTAVAAGGVSITADLRDEGCRDRQREALGSRYSRTWLSVPPCSVASITDSDEDEELLSGTVSVKLSVELGDQMLTQLSVLVDEVATRMWPKSCLLTVPRWWRRWWRRPRRARRANEAAQQAVHTFDLSFNSAHYDTLTGVPTYMNGERTISAASCSWLRVVTSPSGRDSMLANSAMAMAFIVSTSAPSNSDLDSQAMTMPFGSVAQAPRSRSRHSRSGCTTAEGSAQRGDAARILRSETDAETVDRWLTFDFAPDCEGKGKTTPTRIA